MSDSRIYPRMNSQHRFWSPVESRYRVYERPQCIDAICAHCSRPYIFHSEPLPTTRYDPKDGGYVVLKGEVCGEIRGRGACGHCGRVNDSIRWPDAAYLKVELSGGVLWIWNFAHLPAVRARVSGDRVVLRRLIESDWRLARVIGRIPKFATLKKNRSRILLAIDKMQRLSLRRNAT